MAASASCTSWSRRTLRNPIRWRSGLRSTVACGWTLTAAGYRVYAIKPLAVTHYRTATTSRAPNPIRAMPKLLADLVRTDRHNHRPIAGDSLDAEAIKVLARAHQNLTWARTRHTNALRSALREYYPAALRPSRTWPTAMPWVCWAGPPLQLRVLICPRAVAIRGDPPNSERRGQLGHRLTGGRKSAQLRLPIPD